MHWKIIIIIDSFMRVNEILFNLFEITYYNAMQIYVENLKNLKNFKLL